MGYVETISKDRFPKQADENHNYQVLGKRVKVCYHYDTSYCDYGTIVRADVEEPFETIIKLDNGRYVRAAECQYSEIENLRDPCRPCIFPPAIPCKACKFHNKSVEERSKLWRDIIAEVNKKVEPKSKKLLNPCDPCLCDGAPCEQCMFGYKSAEECDRLLREVLKENKYKGIVDAYYFYHSKDL